MIRAVVFDIGGVLEINPDTGWQSKWEQRLHLSAALFDRHSQQQFRRRSTPGRGTVPLPGDDGRQRLFS